MKTKSDTVSDRDSSAALSFAERSESLKNLRETLSIEQNSFKEQFSYREKELEEIQQQRLQTINEVFELNSGVVGFFVRAILGVRAPRNYANRLHALEAEIEALEGRQMWSRGIEKEVTRLIERIQRSADDQNRISLSQQAISALRREYDMGVIEQARKDSEHAREALKESDFLRDVSLEALLELKENIKANLRKLHTTIRNSIKRITSR